jgi:hypothetical protein
MSTQKRKQQTTSRAAKRARFSQQAGSAEQADKKPGGASPLILIAGIAVALLIIGGTVFALMSPSLAPSEAVANQSGDQDWTVSAATHGHEPYTQVVAEDGVVRLFLSTFDDYEAHHYTYMHLGRPIEFFVLKSQDGVVRAAFNACDVCFDAKKGYTQDGDYMICNNCGRRFPADQINVVHGGCNPSPLERTVEGDTLVIQVMDIIAGQDYF